MGRRRLKILLLGLKLLNTNAEQFLKQQQLKNEVDNTLLDNKLDLYTSQAISDHSLSHLDRLARESNDAKRKLQESAHFNCGCSTVFYLFVNLEFELLLFFTNYIFMRTLYFGLKTIFLNFYF